MVNKFDPNALNHLKGMMAALQKAGFAFELFGDRRLKMPSTSNMRALQRLGGLEQLPNSFEEEHEIHISRLIAPHIPEGYDAEVKSRQKRGRSPEMHIDVIPR